MMTSSGTTRTSSGGPACHIPVLIQEIEDLLQPNTDMVIVDATFGAGGYSARFLEKGTTVIALDRDPEAYQRALDMAKNWPDQLFPVKAKFSQMYEVVEDLQSRGAISKQIDAVVMDIGVSSMQLDKVERGFSFQTDGPLDMRMSQSGLSAADYANMLDEGDLTFLFKTYGEERYARAIAKKIIARRQEQPFTTTQQLAKLVEAMTPPSKRQRIHPATRIFQALRMAVNDELGELIQALSAAEQILRPEGHLAVVTFHSLEDRIVKKFIQQKSRQPSGSRHLPQAEDFKPSFKSKRLKPITPSEAEIRQNPRARSAKLRMSQRSHNPAVQTDDTALGIRLFKPSRALGAKT